MAPISPAAEDACPRTWDGWQCWPDTPAGAFARRPCPDYIYYFTRPPTCPRQAYKQCSRAGTWYVGPGGSEWSNYSTCSTLAVLQTRVKTFACASCRPAQEPLPEPSAQLHVVAAFLAVVMLRDDRHSRIQSNSLGCVALLLLTKFCRLASYMWMFCEAFYLHKLVASAFAEQRSLFVYYAIGWDSDIITHCLKPP
ncbi:calcitonin receptor-like [Penaeus monodon]|uniref:calcitonin receptor-like n=1 Tax=Penaeus monodon TaxID=6687 RepID=UPI0018A77CCC|nr:calcitonin receptor-like [Penaeus monodon]